MFKINKKCNLWSCTLNGIVNNGKNTFAPISVDLCTIYNVLYMGYTIKWGSTVYAIRLWTMNLQIFLYKLKFLSNISYD